MKKILVGISGASGAPIAIRLLKRLREMADVETHLIMTKGAELTIVQETDCTVEQVKALAMWCMMCLHLANVLRQGVLKWTQ